METAAPGTPAVIDVSALGGLFSVLAEHGFRIAGPTVRDGAIVCDLIGSTSELPAGWRDEQDAGRYRLSRGDDGALFGYSLGPQGWKRFLHPPELVMLQARLEDFPGQAKPPVPPRYAFVGVRPCELAAIRIHDRVFTADKYVEPGYRARRQEAFIIAVNCTRGSRSCFCKSFGTGPRACDGYDLALTEICREGLHYFVVEPGSDAGAGILATLEHRAASTEEIAQAEAAIAGAENQSRAIETEGLRDLLYESFEHPRWDKTAARCFSCGNCTMVCPTCFCTTVEDSTDIVCTQAERRRIWDSCFTEPFTYIHGGSVRSSVKSRYRQWLTHKMAAWVDQFGTFGCVGCGRCITWCPARIDITEEVAALRGVPPAVRHGMQAAVGEEAHGD